MHHVTGRLYKVYRYAVGINALSSAQKFLFLILEDMRRVRKSPLKIDYCHHYVSTSARVRPTSKWQIMVKCFTERFDTHVRGGLGGKGLRASGGPLKTTESKGQRDKCFQ